ADHPTRFGSARGGLSQDEYATRPAGRVAVSAGQEASDPVPVLGRASTHRDGEGPVRPVHYEKAPRWLARRHDATSAERPQERPRRQYQPTNPEPKKPRLQAPCVRRSTALAAPHRGVGPSPRSGQRLAPVLRPPGRFLSGRPHQRQSALYFRLPAALYAIEPVVRSRQPAVRRMPKRAGP